GAPSAGMLGPARRLGRRQETISLVAVRACCPGGIHRRQQPTGSAACPPAPAPAPPCATPAQGSRRRSVRRFRVVTSAVYRARASVLATGVSRLLPRGVCQ